MYYSKISGTGSFLPKKILTNADLATKVDTSHEWIVSRTGICQRHIASEEESCSFMGTMAAQRALEQAGLGVSDVQMIIVATTTPDQIMPSTACLIQERLGAKKIPAFDITAACTGFIYALSIADQFIRSGMMEHVLVIGTEAMSRIVDWNDRTICVLFGDGAGAVLLSRSHKPGVMSTHLYADGIHKDLLWVPSIRDGLESGIKPTIQMSGREVFRFAVNALGEVLDEALVANELKKEAIQWLIPHQANLRIIEAMAKKLQLPMDKVVVTLDKQANTSAASIPMAMDLAIRDGRIKKDHVVLLGAIGSGFTWGSALIRY